MRLTPMTPSRPASFRSTRQRGIVLPVVLVLLVVLTSLVLMQIRRGTLDQQLSINSRGYTLTETAAQSVLRWCEARAIAVTRNTALTKVPTVDAPIASDAAAWTVVSNWTTEAPYYVSVANVAFPGVATDTTSDGSTGANCLFEDASQELEPPATQVTTSPESAGIGLGAVLGTATGTNPSANPQPCNTSYTHFCKYRVTVRIRPVGVVNCTATPRRCLFMQSELRVMY